MSIRQSEQRLPATLTAADLGQASVEGANPPGRHVLVSFLTSPVVKGTRLEYVVFALDDPPVDEYRWRLEKPGPITVDGGVTETGVFHVLGADPGDVKVVVEVVSGGSIRATLQLDQHVFARDPAIEALRPSFVGRGGVGSEFDTLSEEVYELKQYIVDGAAATGPNGIPPLALAAVLFQEITNRPKDRTTYAHTLRLMNREDDIREPELESMADVHDDITPFRVMTFAEKSLGVGQLAQTTTAMVLGKTPWIEQPRSWFLSRLARRNIAVAYRRLASEHHLDIFNLLRFPRTNIRLTAQLLAMLKNRPHRWPSTAATAFIAEPNALDVVATEYHIGARDTPAASARPDAYGSGVRALVTPGALPCELPRFFP